MTQYDDEPKESDREERRRRTGTAFLYLRQRVEQVCGAIGRADNIADLIDDVISQVSSLISSADAREFLSENDLGKIRDAADRFRSAKSHLDRVADACGKLTDVLNAAEDVLSQTQSPTGADNVTRWPFSRFGPWLTGGVIAAIVIGIVVLLIWDGRDGDEPFIPTDTDTPEVTASPIDCDELTIVFLGIEPLNDFFTENEVSWDTEGGCAPYEVTVNAYLNGQLYQAYPRGDEPNGVLTDSVPSQCGTPGELRYELIVIDEDGQRQARIEDVSAQFGPC